ncbi:MAG: hypothetical protein VX466_08430 [Myxococcota bacterium]|nr:hypothetical protein [Myxococcota bacterium]
MSRSRTIYYDHARGSDEQPAFPQGEAGSVIVESDGSWSSETEVQIGPNSHCALIHHGVADELTALPDARGHAGSGRDLLLPPGSAEAAAGIFYEADRKTYGARYDFLALAQEIPEAIHYRIAIDNREYQQTLSQLQFLSTTAGRHGRGLRIRL